MISGGRPINYLRISVTDRCNFRCRYCVPTAPFKVIEHKNIATYEEILKITRLACSLGITKVRITGGEPFVRKGIFYFLEQLCTIEELKDISITTNGAVLNREKIEKLISFGIKRLNISLDSLDPDTFFKITKRDRFQDVWKAILLAHELGMSPVKLNTVILKGINDHEIEDIAALTLKYPFHIRFIEYMPMGDSAIGKEHQIMTWELMQLIEKRFGPLSACSRSENDGPAKKYKINGAKGIVGFISPISSHFCADCNRLRLTSRGTLRPCLLHDYEKDIITPLRNNASDDDLKKIILESIKHKPATHSLVDFSKANMPVSHMTSIGG